MVAVGDLAAATFVGLQVAGGLRHRRSTALENTVEQQIFGVVKYGDQYVTHKIIIAHLFLFVINIFYLLLILKYFFFSGIHFD